MIINPKPNREPYILAGIIIIGTVISAIYPKDFFTWLLEAGPVIIALPLFALTYKRFPFTILTYRLVTIHCLILVLGAHYTYAEVPLGFWMQDWFGFERNHYDRIGHLAQGIVPAIFMREILIRRSPLKPGKWLFVITLCICLAFSAFYEMIEWWTALLSKEAADSFLGTQGDNWDTQWDMFLAMIGAAISQLIFSMTHDRQIGRLVGIIPKDQT